MLQFLNLIFWVWLIMAGAEMIYEVIDKILNVSPYFQCYSTLHLKGVHFCWLCALCKERLHPKVMRTLVSLLF